MTILGTLSLGELIVLLTRREQDQDVYFDFGGLCVAGIGSYRGFYDHLALSFCEYRESKYQTVPSLLSLLREANGKTYTGYKGGEYLMNLDTPIWASQYGDASSTAIVGLCDCEYSTIIMTEWVSI